MVLATSNLKEKAAARRWECRRVALQSHDFDAHVCEAISSVCHHTDLSRYIVDLHRQLSTLKYSPIEAVSMCDPPPPPESNDSIKEEAHIHTAKVLFAVDKLN